MRYQICNSQGNPISHKQLRRGYWKKKPHELREHINYFLVCKNPWVATFGIYVCSHVDKIVHHYNSLKSESDLVGVVNNYTRGSHLVLCGSHQKFKLLNNIQGGNQKFKVVNKLESGQEKYEKEIHGQHVGEGKIKRLG